MKSLLSVFRALLIVATVLAVGLWSPAAIWYDGPASRALAAALAAAWLAAQLAIALRVRPAWRALLASWVLFALLLAWWFSLRPDNVRNWQPDVARLASAEIDGNRLVIRNVRDFEYPPGAPPVERWESRTYDLDRLVGVDLFLSFWGPKHIAHTITSWEFDDGQHLAISIETRKEVGEEYSAIAGFFRQYEVYYVVADERDVIGVRAGERGETLLLYRMKVTAGHGRPLLLDYLREVNALAAGPRWYNALTHNCTTTIRWHMQEIEQARPWSWQLLANGHLDELGYERGQINTSLPLEKLREASNITARARAALTAPDFSPRIREGLPSRPE